MHALSHLLQGYELYKPNIPTHVYTLQEVHAEVEPAVQDGPVHESRGSQLNHARNE